MDWIINLFTNTESVAHISILYAVVIAVGILLGKIKIGGISLGVTFVLFAGIVAGHIGFTAPVNILSFIQDFGLILFVFCIGLQVGPGFFESFKKGGVTLNLLSTTTGVLNVAVMFACYYIFFDTNDKTNLPMMIGTLYGAVTNTPGLGAANEALESVWNTATNGTMPQIASGYACAYPLGVLGIIGATIAVRFITRTRLADEEEELKEEEAENPHKSTSSSTAMWCSPVCSMMVNTPFPSARTSLRWATRCSWYVPRPTLKPSRPSSVLRSTHHGRRTRATSHWCHAASWSPTRQ